jgi:hypothetical protein
MIKKWLDFCSAFGRSSTDPTQADMNAFIAWLGTVGNTKVGGLGQPMMYRSLEQYVHQVGRSLRQLHNNRAEVVTDSLQTHLALLSSKRLLGDSKQRARPILLPELIMACVGVRGSESLVLAFRVIALTAWFGAMRLGQLLPVSAGQSPTMLLSDLELSEDGQAVLISSTRSKTNVFREKTRKVAVSACAADPRLCLKKALLELQAFRRARQLPLNVPLGSLDNGLSTFDKFVKIMQGLIPAKEPTAHEKGHVTGHSFRRGFTKAALLAGFSIEAIMIHGDWSHPDSVMSSYAAGAVLPSIPMAQHVGLLRSGASSFVAPGGPIRQRQDAEGQTGPSMARAERTVLAVPLKARSEQLVQLEARVARLEQSIARSGQVERRQATPQALPHPAMGAEALLQQREQLAKQVRQLNFDHDRWSPGNLQRPSGVAPAGAGADWIIQQTKRARAWELNNNPALIDKRNKI